MFPVCSNPECDRVLTPAFATDEGICTVCSLLETSCAIDRALSEQQGSLDSHKKGSHRGRFQKGHDPRRHIFTREDCCKG